MHRERPGFIHLYLPLLANQQPDVRRHARAIVLGIYGEQALTSLRRLLDAPNQLIREQAREALLAITEQNDLDIVVQPFQGIYVECLGQLRVYAGNKELQPKDWGQSNSGHAGWQKVRALFAYLVHAGRRGATRARLSFALWGESASATSLSRTLHALRQMLATAYDMDFADRVLTITNDHCILAPDAYHTDARLFEQVFANAIYSEQIGDLELAAPFYQQAMRLYGGPYMVDVLRSCPWCEDQRQHLMNSFIIAAERLAEHAYNQGRYQQCINICHQAIEADETADDLATWLLRAYARLDRRAEIEHAYRRYLRAAAIIPHEADGVQDPVVQLYRSLNLPPPRMQ